MGDASLEDGVYEVKWNDFDSNTSHAFKYLRNNQSFCDVTIVVEDTDNQTVNSDNHSSSSSSSFYSSNSSLFAVQAHRLILSASSPVFHSLLSSNFTHHCNTQEFSNEQNHRSSKNSTSAAQSINNSSTNNVVYLRQVNKLDLLSMLDFIYCGEVNVDCENVSSFLALAEDLKIHGFASNANCSVTHKPVSIPIGGHPFTFGVNSTASSKVSNSQQPGKRNCKRNNEANGKQLQKSKSVSTTLQEATIPQSINDGTLELAVNQVQYDEDLVDSQLDDSMANKFESASEGPTEEEHTEGMQKESSQIERNVNAFVEALQGRALQVSESVSVTASVNMNSTTSSNQEDQQILKNATGSDPSTSVAASTASSSRTQSPDEGDETTTNVPTSGALLLGATIGSATTLTPVKRSSSSHSYNPTSGLDSTGNTQLKSFSRLSQLNNRKRALEESHGGILATSENTTMASLLLSAAAASSAPGGGGGGSSGSLQTVKNSRHSILLPPPPSILGSSRQKSEMKKANNSLLNLNLSGVSNNESQFDQSNALRELLLLQSLQNALGSSVGGASGGGGDQLEFQQQLIQQHQAAIQAAVAASTANNSSPSSCLQSISNISGQPTLASDIYIANQAEEKEEIENLIAENIEESIDGKYICKLCTTVLSYKGSVRRHMRDKHLNSGVNYECKICGKVTCSLNSFGVHMYKMHPHVKNINNQVSNGGGEGHGHGSTTGGANGNGQQGGNANSTSNSNSSSSNAMYGSMGIREFAIARNKPKHLLQD